MNKIREVARLHLSHSSSVKQIAATCRINRGTAAAELRGMWMALAVKVKTEATKSMYVHPSSGLNRTAVVPVRSPRPRVGAGAPTLGYYMLGMPLAFVEPVTRLLERSTWRAILEMWGVCQRPQASCPSWMVQFLTANPDVAQWIEHQSSELRVGGSSPFVRAKSP